MKKNYLIFLLHLAYGFYNIRKLAQWNNLINHKMTISFGMTIALILCHCILGKSQAISSNLLSINGWKLDTVGDYNNCPGVPLNLPCFIDTNNLYKNNRLLDVKNTRPKLVRFGGITADQNNPTKYQYLRFVDSVRARGMEPILQIPVNKEDSTADYDTTNAKLIIAYINDTVDRNVIYWSIGNEPDTDTSGGYGYDTKEEADEIATYIKNFSKAMRRAVPSVPIKIIGPDLAEWNPDPGYTKKKMVDSLVTTTSTSDITGKDPVTNEWWIDYFSFHSYSWNGDSETPIRDSVIAKLRTSKGLAGQLDYLKTKIDAANTTHSRSGSTALKIAITEANIDHQSYTSTAWDSVKVHGFIAGQYWMEIAAIAAEYGVEFVNFWSSLESSMGYMKSDGTKRSIYHHFQQLARWFDGTYYAGSDQDINNNPIQNVKAFGSKNADQMVVFVLNQDTVTTYKRAYSIRLNGTFPSPNDSTEIKIGFGVDKTYQDTIDAASTRVLIFDLYGNISQKYWYKQSDNDSPPGFQPDSCSVDKTYASQSDLNNYYLAPYIYNDITIGNGSNVITLNDSTGTIFRYTGTITIDGPFDSGNKAFQFLPSECD